MKLDDYFIIKIDFQSGSFHTSSGLKEQFKMNNLIGPYSDAGALSVHINGRPNKGRPNKVRPHIRLLQYHQTS